MLALHLYFMGKLYCFILIVFIYEFCLMWYCYWCWNNFALSVYKIKHPAASIQILFLCKKSGRLRRASDSYLKSSQCYTSYTLTFISRHATLFKTLWISVNFAFASIWYRPPTLQHSIWQALSSSLKAFLFKDEFKLMSWVPIFGLNWVEMSYKLDITMDMPVRTRNVLIEIAPTNASATGFNCLYRRTQPKKQRINPALQDIFKVGIRKLPKTVLQK